MSATVILRPNANGGKQTVDTQNYSSGFDANAYTLVDEESPNDSDYLHIYSYINRSGNQAWQSFSFPNPPHIGTVESVKLYYRCRGYKHQGVGSNYVRPFFWANGTPYYGNQTYVEDTVWYTLSQEWTTNPANGNAAWTWTDIDNLDAGIYMYLSTLQDNSAAYTDCSWYYAEIKYLPPACARAQLVGMGF